MAKPKGPSNPKTGNKTPARSLVEITEKGIPSSLDLQLQQLKLDKESKKQKIEEAKHELFLSSLTEEQREERQKTELSERVSWLADRLKRDKKLKEESQEESKQPKKIITYLYKNASIEKFISELQKGICVVDFYKQSSRPKGEFRQMRCTLQNKKVIPQNPLNPGIITVWDLDKDNWRSFYRNQVLRLIRDEQTDPE